MPMPEDQIGLDEMARCFTEEFIRMGYKDDALLALFRDPFYRGPHAVWRRRGEDHVTALIAEVRGQWHQYLSVRGG